MSFGGFRVSCLLEKRGTVVAMLFTSPGTFLSIRSPKKPSRRHPKAWALVSWWNGACDKAGFAEASPSPGAPLNHTQAILRRERFLSGYPF